MGGRERDVQRLIRGFEGGGVGEVIAGWRGAGLDAGVLLGG